MSVSKPYKAWALITFTLVIFHTLCHASQSQPDFSHNSILIINSYTETSLWSNDFIDPIYKEYSTQKNHLDIHTEHMNMLTINDKEALEQYKEELFQRYGNTSPKLIILLGNSAWVLLNKEFEKYWKNVPVILCAEKEYTGPDSIYLKKVLIPNNARKPLTDYQGDIPLTVLYAPFHIEETMELMNTLIPQMKKLVFLSDKRCISAQCRQNVNEVLQTKYPAIKVLHLVAGDITNDTLIDSLRTFDSQTGILFLSWFKKEQQQGNTILTSDISKLLSNYSKAPIFTLHNNALETNGLIGGCFWPSDIIKTTILKTIKEELTTPRTQGIRLVQMGTPGPFINYIDLKNAGLDIDLCPSDTTFSMKPLSFFQQNWYYILIICFMMLSCILYLIWVKKIAAERGRRLNAMMNYSSLIENMPILYVKEELVYDAEGHIIDFIYREINPIFEKYIAPKEQIIGKKQSEINKSDNLQLINLYNSLSNKKELSFQYYIEKTQTYLTVIVTHSKQKGFMDVFCVDNTELALTQQMLHSVNHKLSAALDVADITPWKWDLEKNMILCDVNRPAEMIQEQGLVSEQQLSVPDSTYLSNICKEDKERVETSYRRLINGEISKIKEEFRIISSKGNSMHYEWVEVQATVDDRDENGKPKTLVGSSLVITQRKEMEEALLKAKEKAEESNKLKSAFLANMSHEIRTPLNAIVGFSGILASTDAEDEEEKQEYVHIIEDNNNLLLQLINDILDLSKIEAGTLEFIYSNVDVDDLFLNLEDSAKLRNKNENVQIIYNRRMPECCISTDKNRLTQVVSNMINNSMKFTEKGSIEFGYYKQNDDFLYFYVTDTGQGISEEQIGNIFGRFVKLNAFAQGTGLGLSICQTIVENLGGKIGVTSKVGEGTTFWFTLPNISANKAIQSTKECESYRYVDRKEKLIVLIAEDNESNYKLFESVLKKEYQLIHAWDGEEAVHLFKECNPHIVLMDINMPKMNGYEATRKIREISPDTPVIAITAFAYAEDEQRILNSGFDAYTSKPIQPGKLRTQIVELIKKRLLIM